MTKHLTRRGFLNTSLIGAASLSLNPNAFSDTLKFSADVYGSFNAPKLCIFSKHLHWLEDFDAMASFAAELGFDGIDLTVRKNGHVLPERVSEDLPRTKEAIEKAGLKIYMITTDIQSVSDNHIESILQTASKLGISNYRMGWMQYKPDADILQQIETIKANLSLLAALNKQYNIRGDYQNHSGTYFGSSVWDIWMAIKDLDPRYMGCQFDILHATVEGANSWQNDLKLLRSHIQTIDIKDFFWEKSNNKWIVKKVPLGSGMVNFTKYFDLIKQFGINGPISLHFEYPLGGADTGAKTINIPKQEIAAAMKRDLDALKGMLRNAKIL